MSINKFQTYEVPFRHYTLQHFQIICTVTSGLLRTNLVSSFYQENIVSPIQQKENRELATPAYVGPFL